MTDMLVAISAAGPFFRLMPTYLSADGLEKLKQEWEDRKTKVRAEIAEKISAAKELGDLSENFEYQEAKEQQGQNEGRIMELESMIKDFSLVEQQKGGTINLGSRFTIQVNGAKRQFEIVGSSEADPLQGKISNESPLGQAFMGRGEGDVVEVKVPSGVVSYTLLSIA